MNREESNGSPVAAAGAPKFVLLYDGHCKFCVAQIRRLLAWVRPGAIEALSFQEPGVLERFPTLTYEACMQALHLVTPDGKVYRGFEAGVRALATRSGLKWIVALYRLPGIRQLCEFLYRFVATRRYRIMGRTPDACQDGSCSLHARPN